MKHILISFVALFAFTFPVCEMIQAQGSAGTPVPITPLTPKPCPTCEQRRGPFISVTALTEPLQLVIKDLKQWQEIWERINCKVISPVPPLPEIDFAKDMLVVVALGTRPTGGYGIIVESAFDKDNRREIIVRKQTPGKNCFTTQAITRPVDIVRMPKTDRQIVFKETEVVHECK